MEDRFLNSLRKWSDSNRSFSVVKKQSDKWGNRWYAIQYSNGELGTATVNELEDKSEEVIGYPDCFNPEPYETFPLYMGGGAECECCCLCIYN